MVKVLPLAPCNHFSNSSKPNTMNPTTAPTPPAKRGYFFLPHVNSNNAKRRRLFKWGERHVSLQVVKWVGAEAQDLPKGVNPAVARYAGGKYPVPFVGLKQQRKMEGLV